MRRRSRAGLPVARCAAGLRYYASQFSIVEIDSSHYGIPTGANARLWVERTPPGFVFNIKAYRIGPSKTALQTGVRGGPTARLKCTRSLPSSSRRNRAL